MTHCPTCGTHVMVVAEDESTCHYRPLTERQVRVATIEAILDLIDQGYPGERDAELVPHSNGYGLWLIRRGQMGTAPLDAQEIADMIENVSDRTDAA